MGRNINQYKSYNKVAGCLEIKFSFFDDNTKIYGKNNITINPFFIFISLVCSSNIMQHH